MAESEEAFEVPVARIATPGHIEVFRTSQACAKLRGYPFLFSFTMRLAHIHVGPRFIIALNTAAKGKLGTPDPPHSPIITKLVALLDRLGETNPICLGPVAIELTPSLRAHPTQMVSSTKHRRCKVPPGSATPHSRPGTAS